MKLIHLTLPENKPSEIRLVRSFSLVNPVDSVLGWRVLVRGPAVILLAPDGPGHEFARSACVLTWDSSTAADYDKIATYTSEVLARRAAGQVEGKP